MDAGCYFDIRAADRVRYFFARFLRHSKGAFAGKPFELLDWQWNDLIAPAYGWKMPDGTRRIRRIGCAVPKKNGKSTLLSGIGLYMLVGDGEAGAEVYTAASDKEQSSIIFGESANMAERSPALRRRLWIRRNIKKIQFDATRSFYRALAFEATARNKEGFNASCVLFDELHAQRNRLFWNTLRYAGASRAQPMLWWISTAGVKSAGSLWEEQWDYAKKVLSGEIVDVSYLPCIYETPEGADWRDESVWRAANPSYGTAIDERGFAEACVEATNSPVNENNFKRYRLNMRVAQEVKWLSQEKWDALDSSVTEAAMLGKRCVIGLDLATTSDIAAATVTFPVGENGYAVIPYFWVPGRSLVRRRVENRTRLDEWVARGFIRVTDRPTIDYAEIRRDINALGEKFKVERIASDPWNATQLATELESDGFEVVFVRQTFGSLTDACKELERAVLDGRVAHDGSPVMSWMIDNVTADTDANENMKPNKRRSADKIDGVTAMLNAIAVLLQFPEKRSVYETRGIRVL